MHDKTPYILLASAAALSMALSQAALGQAVAPPAPQAPAVVAPAAPQAAEVPPAPVAPAPAAVPAAPAAAAPANAEVKPMTGAADHVQAAQKRMDERRAELMAKRKQRYEELRKRAETAGLNLPETPPWEDDDISPPKMPAMPEMPAWTNPPGMEDMGGPGGLDDAWMARHEQAMQAMRERAKQRASARDAANAPWNLMTPEEQRAQMEKMRNATPEERAAIRDQHWAEMRERAAAKGISMPETPPWKEAEQRRAARKAQWENYLKVIDKMSAEQLEAAEAIFSQPPQPPMGREMNPPMPYGQEFGTSPDMPYGPPTQGYGGPGYPGQPMPWSGGYPNQMPAPMMNPNSGYNRW